MIYVDRNSIPVPEIFFSKEIRIAQRRLEDFYSRAKKSRSQERFVQPFESNLRKGFLEYLRILFNSKCAYCESLIKSNASPSQYDHFRPKNGARGFGKEFSNDHYWWLTYEWRNLYYCCQKCNQYKSTWFPVEGKRIEVETPYSSILENESNLIVDPCVDKPEEHLFFREDGHTDFLSLKGRTTIEILKLNRSDLVYARKNALELLYGDWERFLKLWRNQKLNINKIKELAIEWDELFSNSTQKYYVASQRQMLSKWLSNHPEIHDFISKKKYNLIKEDILVQNDDPKPIHLIEEVKRFDKDIIKETERELIEEAINFEDIRHVYIDKIVLKNFKCFANLTVTFGMENLNSVIEEEKVKASWQLFLGENGVGKSSILKAITIALCGENYFPKLKLTPSSLLQRGKRTGYIKLFFKGEDAPIEVKFNAKKIKTSIKEPKANLIGYGSVRLLPIEGKLSPEKFRKGGIKAKNLFDYSVSLANAHSWLLERSQEDFDIAAITLKDLMLLDNKVLLKRNIQRGKIFIQNGKSKIDVDELSDGYQSVYALAVDIMASFVDDKMNYEFAEGIILIDEIGTHLHPRWKMEVVSQLRRAFPKMQFIVTTHEPLCLRGLKEGEVVVLTKDWDNIIICITDLPDPSTLRVDQLLTSPFFGLHSAVDPTTEKIFTEYYSLLAKEKLNAKEENRKNELSDLIPKIKYLGDTLREELAIYVIDELLAKKKNSFKLDELKKEAKERVKLIWDSITSDNS
jgi:uncharacterized protein (TIGR02646 family)